MHYELDHFCFYVYISFDTTVDTYAKQILAGLCITEKSCKSQRCMTVHWEAPYVTALPPVEAGRLGFLYIKYPSFQSQQYEMAPTEVMIPLVQAIWLHPSKLPWVNLG